MTCSGEGEGGAVAAMTPALAAARQTQRIAAWLGKREMCMDREQRPDKKGGQFSIQAGIHEQQRPLGQGARFPFSVAVIAPSPSHRHEKARRSAGWAASPGLAGSKRLS
ncbi:hypothetical protein CS8_042900 [Cupriavidus sp. 8B]